MGTLANIAPILGLLAGLIIAKLVPYELKQGKKYFIPLQYALLIAVIGMTIWQKLNGQKIDISIPAFLLFIPVGTLHHKKYLLLAGTAAAYIIISLLIF
jgi:hypothetical protein